MYRYHVAMTQVSGERPHLYINGQEDTDEDHGDDPVSPNYWGSGAFTNAYLGRGGAGNYLDGNMWDFRIYGRALR
jgi:hypothetical protein